MAERPDASDDFVRLTSEYIAGGVMRLLLGWLDDPRGVTREDVLDALADVLPGWLSGSGADA